MPMTMPMKMLSLTRPTRDDSVVSRFYLRPGGMGAPFALSMAMHVGLVLAGSLGWSWVMREEARGEFISVEFISVLDPPQGESVSEKQPPKSTESGRAVASQTPVDADSVRLPDPLRKPPQIVKKTHDFSSVLQTVEELSSDLPLSSQSSDRGGNPKRERRARCRYEEKTGFSRSHRRSPQCGGAGTKSHCTESGFVF